MYSKINKYYNKKRFKGKKVRGNMKQDEPFGFIQTWEEFKIKIIHFFGFLTQAYNLSTI